MHSRKAPPPAVPATPLQERESCRTVSPKLLKRALGAEGSSQVRPKLVDVGQTLVKLDKDLARSAEHRSIWPKSWPDVGQMLANFDQVFGPTCGPNSAKFGRLTPTFDQHWPNIANVWPTSTSSRRNLGRTSATGATFRKSVADMFSRNSRVI